MAAAKRSRLVTSSSLGEIGLLDLVQPIESSHHALARRMRAAPLFNVSLRSRAPPPMTTRSEAEQRQFHDRRGLFSFGPADDDGEEAERYGHAWDWRRKWKQRRWPGEGYCEFLEGCYFCNKKLDLCHVYMYGYLGAFCSPECRDNQIALDGFEQQISKESSMLSNQLQQERLAL